MVGTEKIKIRNEAFLKYKRNMNPNNYEEYKKIEKEIKDYFKEKKITNWKKFCGSLTKDTPIKNVWAKIKTMKNIGTFRNNKVKKDSVIEEFKEILAPPTVTQETVIYPNQDQAHFLNDDFTTEELELTLKYKRDTSPGFDNFPTA